METHQEFSLPADVLWGSFVTHSFLPHESISIGNMSIIKSLIKFCSLEKANGPNDKVVMNVGEANLIIPNH